MKGTVRQKKIKKKEKRKMGKDRKVRIALGQMKVAYLAFFSIIRIPFGMLTLIIAHTTFCIPYIFINVQSRLVGLDPAYRCV